MACMEHNCGTCGEMWFNNDHGRACPKCGSQDISSFFDEASEPYTEIEALNVDARMDERFALGGEPYTEQEEYDHEHPPLRDDPMETER